MIDNGVKTFLDNNNFNIGPNECKKVGIRFSIPEVEDGLYDLGIIASTGQYFSSMSMQFNIGLSLGTLGNAIELLFSKLSWEYDVEGNVPFTIPYAGFMISIGIAFIVFMMVKSVKKYKGDKKIPYIASLISVLVVLMMLP